MKISKDIHVQVFSISAHYISGSITAVGQSEIPPKVGIVGIGAIRVGAIVGVGNVGVNVGVTVGVKVGTVGTISGVGQSGMPPPTKVGVVGTGGVKVGTVGVKVGNVGVKVGVKVGIVGAIMAAGKVVGVTGTVGTAPNIIAVGQSEIPPKVGVVGTGAVVMVGVKVGSIKGVIPGAIPGTGAVVTVGKGGKITAKPIDEIKTRTVIKNKPMKNKRSDFI